MRMEKGHHEARARDIHVAPGLRPHVLRACFSKNILCQSCGQGIPRRGFEAHIYACPAKREQRKAEEGA